MRHGRASPAVLSIRVAAGGVWTPSGVAPAEVRPGAPGDRPPRLPPSPHATPPPRDSPVPPPPPLPRPGPALAQRAGAPGERGIASGGDGALPGALRGRGLRREIRPAGRSLPPLDPWRGPAASRGQPGTHSPRARLAAIVLPGGARC